MIITAIAMYLNVVHEANFNYIITFIGDIILLSCISIENIIGSKK